MLKSLKVLRYAIPYWSSALLNIIFNLLSVIFSLVSFALFIPVLQIIFDRTKRLVPGVDFNPDWHSIHDTDSLKQFFYGSTSQMIEIQGEMKALLYISILIVVLYLLKNLFRYLAMFFLATVRNGVVKDLRNALYYKALILPLSFYTQQRKGDLMARMGGDVQEVELSIMSSLEMLFRDPITIIVYLITLFIIQPVLTGFVLVLLPISGFLIAQVGKSLKRTSQKSQKKMGYLMSLIEETLSGIRIIKAFNAIDESREHFEKENHAYTRMMTRLYRKRDLASPLSEFLCIVVVVVVLMFGGRLILSQNSSITAEVFLVYIGIFTQLIPPAKSIVQAFYNIQKGAASVDRINQILKAEEVIVEKPNAFPKKSFEQRIEYRNVSFRYEEELVLRNINLIIEKGQTVAIVGQSGSGKSTLVDLLPRFYDCTEGCILLDGIDIRDYRIDDLRGLMGIVSQETILFNDTVFNNIALGMKKVSQHEVEKAAKIANANEFIMQMPEGYQTLIGDRGTKLSGGQRQRLSIARAVLKNPPILILDEATSALDTESERLVQQALDKLMENRTSIVIAHRLSTIRFADMIVVLHQGEIVEKGKHETLYTQGEFYRKLCDMQSFL